ncbi:MAG: DinB family protein [Anaerolineales bacterium]
MPHPLVEQLYFTRSEWLRGLQGVGESDAVRHFGPMNCISWVVGHLAWQEQGYWLFSAQGEVPLPELHDQFRYGAAKSTPALADTLPAWHQVTEASESYLGAVTGMTLEDDLTLRGRSVGQSIGSALLRMIYHYWYHIGEVQAIRQLIGHSDLPEFVGDIEQLAPYKPG